MAIEKVYLSEGVSLTAFNAHTHSYRKLTQIGCDSDDKWLSPVGADVVDDTTTHVKESVDLEAIGVSVVTSPTSTPV